MKLHSYVPDELARAALLRYERAAGYEPNQSELVRLALGVFIAAPLKDIRPELVPKRPKQSGWDRLRSTKPDS